MSRTKHHGNKAKKRIFGDRWRWMNTPSWWIREFMTVKQRAQTRDLIKKTISSDAEDAPEFPLAKKPHKYYW